MNKLPKDILIKVFLTTSTTKERDDWMACLDVGYGEARYYGKGSTMEEALAETGRLLDAQVKIEREEYAKTQASAKPESVSI